ncbi:MAG: hypothetical protein BroJett011_32840 [Chloroflexota bacterium]|nr:MAG: hypothetical protein BroJett011_32840 [Chloroflexota bacterium]
MGKWRRIAIILGGVLFIGLLATVGLMAYRLGQQSLAGNEPAPTDVALASPSATSTAAQPPPVITNTPTATPTPSPTPGPTNTPTPTPTNTPIPSPTPIIVKITELGRLETTEFAMRTVIDLEKDPSNLWEQLVGTDKLMLIAEGEVVAGFDLQKVDQKKDVKVQGATIKLTLPPPEILYSRIDNEKSYVYERRTGLLVKPDPTLESRARLLAEQNLVEWAEQRGIYQKAEVSGRAYLENFLRSLGFTDITIEVKKKGI